MSCLSLLVRLTAALEILSSGAFPFPVSRKLQCIGSTFPSKAVYKTAEIYYYVSIKGYFAILHINIHSNHSVGVPKIREYAWENFPNTSITFTSSVKQKAPARKRTASGRVYYCLYSLKFHFFSQEHQKRRPPQRRKATE